MSPHPGERALRDPCEGLAAHPAPTPPRKTPRQEYEGRLADGRRLTVQLDRSARVISALRLATAGLGILTGWLALGAEVIAPLWVIVPVGLFVVLVLRHDRVLQRQQQAEQVAGFYAAGLDRLDGRWADGGPSGDRFLDPSHLFAADLDLFGPSSLFALLCTARTRAGEQTLADWLLSPAAPEVVRARQEAIDELRFNLALREDLAVIGPTVSDSVDLGALAAWGEKTLRLPRYTWAIAAALSGLSFATLAGWGIGRLSPVLVLASFSFQGVFAWTLRTRVRSIVGTTERPARDLALLAAVLERIEREQFRSPALVKLRAALERGGVAASTRIATLGRFVSVLGWRANQFFAPVAAMLLWATQIAGRLGEWRASQGPSLAAWVSALGALEAYCALATYAFEHPEDPFPCLTTDAPARFDAEGLGHPLIPAVSCVRNDVRIGLGARLLVVSGSNMSGKSTLLRAVGVNTALALAGGPVRARRLTLSPLQIGATLRVQDSLATGASQFYAEITRVRRITERAAAEPPLLFLLDEILHGTNSHDRLIGARAIVRGLLDRGAIGLVTTHDLALTDLADGSWPDAVNVHFEDHLDDQGRITFDYRMRPGVVSKSNAIALMRAVGLDVPAS